MENELAIHFRISNLNDYTLQAANNLIQQILNYCKKAGYYDLEIYASECDPQSEPTSIEPPF